MRRTHLPRRSKSVLRQAARANTIRITPDEPGMHKSLQALCMYYALTAIETQWRNAVPHTQPIPNGTQA